MPKEEGEMERQVVIASAARTPLAQLGGALSMVPAGELSNIAISEAVRRAGLDMKDVDEIIMGNVLGYGASEETGLYAKTIPGLGEFAGTLTTKEAGGSCLILAALGVAMRYADVAVAGGFENASLFYQASEQGPITGRIRELWYAGCVLDSYLESAGLLADELGISHQAIRDFVNASYAKALEATKRGKFALEIVPIKVHNARGAVTFVDADEILPIWRSQLQDSPSVFGTNQAVGGINRYPSRSLGIVTKQKAWSAHDYPSRIVDGAAALVFMSKEKAEKLRMEPLAEVVAWSTPETEPYNEAMASVLAINNVLSRADLQPGDVDLCEIDEVCSAGTVAIVKKLGIDPQRVNVRGGSLALGYPIGASAARMLTTLLYTMKDLNAKTGMLSLCIGGRDAVSMLVKRE